MKNYYYLCDVKVCAMNAWHMFVTSEVKAI